MTVGFAPFTWADHGKTFLKNLGLHLVIQGLEGLFMSLILMAVAAEVDPSPRCKWKKSCLPEFMKLR